MHTEIETETGTLSLRCGVTETERDGVTFYGFYVEAQNGERSEVNDVTSDRAAAERILKMLADGAVTPTPLYDVVTDLME